MSAHETPPARIELAGDGLGEISEEVVMRRALELAIADGRSHRNEKDVVEARRELFSGSASYSTIPEAPGEPLSAEWGSPPASVGMRTPRVRFDDDANLADQLVREGAEEAERDTRTHSNDGKEIA